MTHEIDFETTMPAAPSDADLNAVIDEFGRVLGVFGAQLTDSLHQADREFGVIGAAFEELAAANDRIHSIVFREPELTLVRGNCERIGDALSAAVTGLQCHDRLAQQLGHVRGGLDHLQGLFRDGKERSYGQWLALLRGLEQAHRTEQSRLAAADGVVNAHDELF